MMYDEPGHCDTCQQETHGFWGTEFSDTVFFCGTCRSTTVTTELKEWMYRK